MTNVSVAWVGITGVVCLGLLHIRKFGTVANLEKEVVQETLSFLIPPLIAVTCLRWGDSKIQ